MSCWGALPRRKEGNGLHPGNEGGRVRHRRRALEEELKSERTKRWAAAAFLLALPSVLFFDVLVTGKSFLSQDIVLYAWPFRNLCQQMWQGGELFFWDLHRFCGTPLVGNAQIPLFYPPNALFYLLDTGKALVYSTLLHLGCAGAFMLFYLAYVLKDWRAGLVGGLLFELGGFCVIQAARPPVLCAAVWLPLCLLFFEMSLEGDARRHARYALAAGLALALSVLGGFFQMTFHIALLMTLCALHAALRRRGPGWRRALAALLLAGAAGLGASAVHLLPVVAFNRFFPRDALVDPAWYGVSYSLQLSQLVPYLLPELRLPPPPGAANDELAYLGVVTLLCAFFSLRSPQQSRARFLWRCFALFLVLSFGLATPLYHGMLALPLAGKFRCPIRLLFLANFCVTVLAAMGVSVLLARVAQRLRRTTFLFVALLALVCCGSLARERIVAGNDDLFRTPPREVVVPPLEGRVLTTPGIQGWCANLGCVTGSANVIGSDGQILSYFLEFLFFSEQGRMPTQQELGAAANFGYTVPLARVDTPMMRLAGLRYVLRGSGSPGSDLAVTRTELPTRCPKAFLVFAVRVIPDARELLEAISSKSFNPMDEALLAEAPCLPVAGAHPPRPEGSMEVTRYHPNEVLVSVKGSPAPAMLVLGDTYYDEWRVSVNGRESRLHRAYHAMRAVCVPAGDSQVRFHYVPMSFHAGLSVTLLSLLLIAGVFALTASRRPVNA